MVTVIGDAALRRFAKRAGPALVERLGPAIALAAESLRGHANSIVPRASGALAASAFVDGPATMNEGHTVACSVGYDAEHAAGEHEGFHYGRRTTTAPPKWLERAGQAAEPDFGPYVADSIREALRGLAK